MIGESFGTLCWSGWLSASTRRITNKQKKKRERRRRKKRKGKEWKSKRKKNKEESGQKALGSMIAWEFGISPS